MINPPVLAFWLIAFAQLTSNAGITVQMQLASVTILFFIGIFWGKATVLWLYQQLSKNIDQKAQNLTTIVNKSIAVLVFSIGCIQLARLLL